MLLQEMLCVNHIQTVIMCVSDSRYFVQTSFKLPPFPLELLLGTEVVVKIVTTQWTKPTVRFIASFQP